MDFGVVGLEGLVGPEGGALSQVTDPETKTKGLGSGFVKQERTGPDEDYWRSSKMVKTEDLTASKTMPLHQGTSLLRSNSMLHGDTRQQQQQQEHMLSFSSHKPEVSFLTKDGGLLERNTQSSTFPYYQRTPSAAYSRNAGISFMVFGLIITFSYNGGWLGRN